jgi:hypothetical protein
MRSCQVERERGPFKWKGKLLPGFPAAEKNGSREGASGKYGKQIKAEHDCEASRALVQRLSRGQPLEGLRLP